MSTNRFIAQAMHAASRTVAPGWGPTTLGNVLELVNGRAYKQEELLPSGVPVLRIQNLNGGDRWYYSDLELDPGKYCHAGDLLFAWSATFGPYRYAGPRAIFHYHIWRIVPRPGLDADFAFWLLKEITAEVKAAAHGVAMPHMTKAGMEAWPISLPPIDEQRRIVVKLEALQTRSRRARDALAAVAPLLEKLRRSILAAAFRGDLTKDWRARNKSVEPATELLKRIRAERRKNWEAAELAKLKAKGRAPTDDKWKARYREPEAVDAADPARLPETWCWARFEELCLDLRGGVTSRAQQESTPFKVLRSSSVRHGSIDLHDVSFVREDAPEDFQLTEGDILLTRLSGTLEYVANAAVVGELGGERIQYPDRIFRARTSTLVERQFIASAFGCQHLRAPLEEAAKSTAGHQRISMSDLADLLLPLPPRAEQSVIAELLQASLKVVAEHRRAARSLGDSLSLLDRSILATAFRGELVPQDSRVELGTATASINAVNHDSVTPARTRARSSSDTPRV